jgi:formamidopyrimidine-DNA glycosylase
MPELPEVEVCRLGISPHISNQTVASVTVRNHQLRWPVPNDLNKLCNQVVLSVERRAKYLLIRFNKGSLVLHLGMSGTLRIIDSSIPIAKHDHFDLAFSHGKILRLNDPRRFGAVLWFENHIDEQGLLAKLGPEPLRDEFTHEYLYSKAKNRKVPIKTFLMNNHIVVGVGNIYANEVLFLTGINPLMPTGKLTKRQSINLTVKIKEVLKAAIKQGGTTLKDFTQADGRPGYFAQSLFVYGRAGKKCLHCESVLEEIRQSNRSSVFCPSCQK